MKINPPILLLGIGIFFWLAISGFGYAIKKLFMDFMMNMENGNGIWIGIIGETFELVFILAGLKYLIHILKSKVIKLETLFFVVIGLLFLSQIFQFIIPIGFEEFFRSEFYFENLEFFYANTTYHFISGGIGILTYILMIILIYQSRNDILAEKDQIEKIGNSNS